MALPSETGHVKISAHFHEVIAVCSSYGASYNPTKASLTIAALTAAHANAVAALANVNTALPAYTNAVNDRENAFAPISKLVTKISNAVKASDVPDNLLEDVKTITRKLQGKRATPKKVAADGSPAKTHSVSQLSYDQRIGHFDQLVHLLASQANYAPNEAEISVASLTLLLAQLRTVNTAAINAAIPLSQARIARNAILYAPKTGLVDLAADVKAYVKSIFGATDPQYKLLSGLKFTVPRGL